MSDLQIPICADDERRADLLRGPAPPHVDLNGIDFVEVDPADHRILRVTFLKPLPAGGYGIPADPTRVRIDGGTRIVGIKATAAAVESASVLRIDVSAGGDYSPYELTLDATPPLDPVRAHVTFSFMASCPTGIDCRPAPCPPEELVEPRLDYLAKDYASFRQLMLDLLPTLNPDWLERNPSDLGIALVELLAYAGDRLSYYQDAVANEAYLETVRTRISARRHARLVDYRMHDGRNAWVAVHLSVNGTGGTLPRGTALFSEIVEPLPGEVVPPSTRIPAGALTVDILQQNPSYRDVVAFETAFTKRCYLENNEIRLHTFGEEECCLAKGTTEAYLYFANGVTAVRPQLVAGDYLVLEERVGPRTGAVPDADPKHRQLVRIEAVEVTEDQLYAETLVAGIPVVRTTAQNPLPLLRVRWRRADALRFTLCLSARLRDGSLVREVSVGRGNIVLADAGLTTEETQTPDVLTVDGRMLLSRGPLTMEARALDAPVDAATGRFAADRFELGADVRAVAPALTLQVATPIDVELWRSMPDLLDSNSFDEHFVAEIDDEGRAVLRFGDGEYGRRLPDDATALRAVYRIGNGRSGNVGAGTVVHVAPVVASTWIDAVRNPLAARAGVDAETIEQVRQLAPQAFHTELFRAVTEEDWAQAAKRLAGVQGAVASYRWTGSWTTIFVAVDPEDRADLVDLPNGFTRLAPDFERQVRAFLTRYRLAGYDIELRPPRFVPVQLEVEVCAKHGYFRSDVAASVRAALSNRVLPDGSRGFFHPSNFTFGDALYLSRLYAAVERVEGVESVAIRKLVRYGQPDVGELARGALAVGPWEIVRLDDDPSFVEHGILTVTARGGKA